MKANSGKCHLITSSSDEVSVYVKNCNIKKKSKCQKLLGIKIDKSNLNNHIDEICKKAGQKLNWLSKRTRCMVLAKWHMFLNVFFLSQFSYCPLVWMLYSHCQNIKINQLHERCLWVIYSDKKSTFTELMRRFLAIEPLYIIQRNDSTK